MKDFFLLTIEQCSGPETLDILKKRGNKALMTDFSIILSGRGGFYSKNNWEDCIGNGEYWTKSIMYYWNTPYTISHLGGACTKTKRAASLGVRPAIQLSSLDDIPTNRGKVRKTEDGVLECEYGYYPQQAAPQHMQQLLESKFQGQQLLQTGRSYTINTGNDFDKEISPKQYQEFQYNGKRFIRVGVNNRYFNGGTELSNGQRYQNGEYVWIEVSPIKWLIDEKTKIMVAERLMFSGCEYEDIEKIMNGCFSEEIEQFETEEYLEKISIEALSELADCSKNDLIEACFTEEEAQIIISRLEEHNLRTERALALDKPIEELGLNAIAYNALRDSGIENYEDLTYFSGGQIFLLDGVRP